MLKLKLQYFGHLMGSAFEKTLMLGKIEGRRRRGQQRMASPTQGTWAWVDSRSWWWTGRPGMLQFMGSQRVGHNWATELTELKWTGMGKFNSDDHYVYYWGQESLRRNGVVLTVNKRVWNAVVGCSLKNDRMISVCFQGKPFSIKIIQVYALTTNVEEAGFYKDLQDLPELTPKRCPFHHRGLKWKSRKSRDTWNNRHTLNVWA